MMGMTAGPPAPAPPMGGPVPPPPPIPNLGGPPGGMDMNSLAAQLQQAKLKRGGTGGNKAPNAPPPPVENSGSSTSSGGSGNYGTIGRTSGGGMASMMDEMQKTLARRRAQAEKKPEVSRRVTASHCGRTYDLFVSSSRTMEGVAMTATAAESPGKSPTHFRTNRTTSTRTEAQTMVLPAAAMEASHRGQAESGSAVRVKRQF